MNQTQPVTLRRADEADLDGLEQLLTGLSDLSRWFRFQTAIGTPPRPALLLRMLRPAGAAWVASRDDRTIGHAMWAWATLGVPDMVDGRVAELAAVIADDEQGRGLGVHMLAVAAADAIASGATHFLFVVSTSNDASLRMVRRRWPDAVAERDGGLLTFVAPARLPDQPKESANVIHEQVRCLQGREMPAPRELRPVHDPVPTL
ncbi:GNAT family N-acetyltransferase [Kribbella antibiotica]|uniref:GNAT family N-acetyltransferase n=1 Tax=Kribbella antibiotica TaxID=190195 RepID=A0A4R4YF63_9ACTN|nr:GNAT family N-acetyltransferase [Kribbella antibiotica]